METKRKIGTVGYIASTKGIKFRENPNEWFNPTEALKDKISEKLKDCKIEITLIDDKGTFSDFQQLDDGPEEGETLKVTEETVEGPVDVEDLDEETIKVKQEIAEEIPESIEYSSPEITNEESNIFLKLSLIQTELKVGKNHTNNFGKYSYRNMSDILEALKPLLKKYSVTITITDRLVGMGNRYYIEATATLSDGVNSVSTTALARESDDKKGMDSAQVTGSTSSYARKYALNGLLAIDDTKDIDAGE